MKFLLLEWSACADSLSLQSEWLDWACASPALPAARVGQVPAVAEMPAMMRRRIDRLGRLACQVAYWCGDGADDAPMVFASRYGDADRSLALLGELVQGQPVSPAGFGLSVHNAVSALYSIAQKHVGNTVVVAAGRATVEAALVEAAALLADGAPEVLVVCYEAPLPDDYAVFEDETLCEYAWAWRIAAAGAQRPGHVVELDIEPAGAPADSEADELAGWPGGLAVLRHVLRQVGPAATPKAALLWRQAGADTRWRWSAHA